MIDELAKLGVQTKLSEGELKKAWDHYQDLVDSGTADHMTVAEFVFDIMDSQQLSHSVREDVSVVVRAFKGHYEELRT